MAMISCLCYNYYSVAEENTIKDVKHHYDDTLRVAFIGDSWANLHKKYDQETNKLLIESLQKPVSFVSSGIPGATSKLIYSHFSEENSPIHKQLKNGLNYCIISAGINDTQLKIGSHYYSQHIRMMMDILIANQITPIIIEIPNYNIFKAYHNLSFSQKVRRHISMFVSGSHIDCREHYRHSLNNILENSLYKNKVLIIRHATWNASGYKDHRQLYETDGIHLNTKGYKLLDRHIIHTILKDYFNNH